MVKMMKAAVVARSGSRSRSRRCRCQRRRPGEVLIKIVASGVCHTDLHAADGDWPVKPRLPFVPGHEGAASWRPSARASRA